MQMEDQLTDDDKIEFSEIITAIMCENPRHLKLICFSDQFFFLIVVYMSKMLGKQ